ncbi:Homeobox domain-containing protein [Pseudozyma hubeiensis]|nr:Homeobox domain-containing protein [Pseudozyma hubeiensis]
MTLSHEQSFSLRDLLESLNSIEHSLLQDNGQACPRVLDRLELVHQYTLKQVSNTASDPDLIQQVRQAARRIQVVADTAVCLERHSTYLSAEITRDASELLQNTDVSRPRLDCYELSEKLPSYHMRKHFLETLASPYPTQEQKEVLVRITNESSPNDDSCSTSRPPLGVHQLTLWFINARRRSGWSHILKKFAREDRSRMKRLVQAKLKATDPSTSLVFTHGHLPLTLDDVLRDNLGRTLTPADKKQFEDDWASMISWIKYGVKEKVGDWVYDLVSANKNKKALKPGKARTVNIAATRSPARKTAATTTQSKPRKAKQRASKTPSIESNTESERFESTPELSMCSTSDTSFSTLCSNLSMARYSPFDLGDDVLKSPSLNALNSRRVKALPKRGQKQLLDAMHTDAKGVPSIGTCYPVAEEAKPRPSFEGHAQATGAGNGQTTSYLSAELSNFPPFDALGQVPMPIRRESLSSNSLSAAFC